MSATAAIILEWGIQIIDAVLVTWFLCRLAGTRPRVSYGLGYLALSFALSLVFVASPTYSLLGWAGHQLISLAAVCLYIFFVLKASWPVALAATSIVLVCNALFSQVGALLTYALWNSSFPYIDLVLVLLIHIGRFAAFWCIARTLGPSFANTGNRYLHLFLLPCALLNLLFADSFYTLVGSLQMGGGDGPLVVKSACTVLLASGGFCLALYIFKKAGQFITLEQERGLLAQEVQNQRRYIAQATQHNEQSRALQHDLQNHLLVLAGFLEKKEIKSAEHYLQKLNATAGEAMPLPATGRPAVDVLLGEKLAAARRQGIMATCRVHLPADGGLDEFDLCVVFANALDNALHACANLPEGRWLAVEAKHRQRFLALEFSNAAVPAALQEGTGLGNIRRVAAKYSGTVEITQTENTFHLAVLLCLPGQP